MENNNNQEIYISGYRIVQIKTIPYIEYIVTGVLVLGELRRRYSDFCLLRRKITEIYPCIAIPGLPPKKAIGNLDSEYIELRISILNNFLISIIKLNLIDCEPVKVFILNDENFKIKLTNINKKSVFDLSQLYYNKIQVQDKNNNYNYEKSFKTIFFHNRVIIQAKPNIIVKIIIIIFIYRK